MSRTPHDRLRSSVQRDGEGPIIGATYAGRNDNGKQGRLTWPSLPPLFAALGRQAGRVLTTALGWASTLLFGRVSHEKHLLLTLISMGSLAWVVLLLGE